MERPQARVFCTECHATGPQNKIVAKKLTEKSPLNFAPAAIRVRALDIEFM